MSLLCVLFGFVLLFLMEGGETFELSSAQQFIEPSIKAISGLIRHRVLGNVTALQVISDNAQTYEKAKVP